MTLSIPGTFHTTKRADVLLSLLPSAKPLKNGARVHFHAHTTESIAEVRLYSDPDLSRVQGALPRRDGAQPRPHTSEALKQLTPGGETYAQLRFAEPLLLLPGDRFIVRQFSPVMTIGGGIVLDAAPLNRKQPASDTIAFLKTMRDGSPEEALAARVRRHGTAGLPLDRIPGEMNIRPGEVARLAAKAGLLSCSSVLVTPEAVASAKTEVLQVLKKFHDANPLVAGMSKEELRDRVNSGAEVFSSVLQKLTDEKKLEVTGELVHLSGRGVVMKDDEAESKKIIEHAFASAGLKVPSLKEVLASLKVDKTRAQKIVTLLLRDKILIKISEELVFHQSALMDLRRQVAGRKTKAPKIDVAAFKDMTGVSRKYAIPLLEYLDRERVTRRVGDERLIL
jgi:selenocysteine-specific elongation factor